jgi:NAD(P)-dependent dehydrogenase (short-subunit alcohol dehydrogenase family)
MDLLDLDGIDALAARLADVPIDVLLNNAAMLGEPNDQNLGNLDYDLMKQVLNVNVVGTMKMV